jgi:hypothetical protein
MYRIPHFLDNRLEDGGVCQPHALAVMYSKEICSFLSLVNMSACVEDIYMAVRGSAYFRH